MIDPSKDLSGLPDPIHDAQFYNGVAVKRLIAFVIDFIIIIGVSVGFGIATLGLGFFVFPLISFAVSLIYRIFFIGKTSATLGMSVAGIELRTHRGEKLTMIEAVWHTFVFTGVFMFFLTNLASIIMMLVNERGQGLHDYLLGTTAINRPVD